MIPIKLDVVEVYKPLFVTNDPFMIKVMVLSPRNSGKAQPLYSKIQTPNGEISMKDIKVGDEIFDINGGTQYVTGVFPQGKKQIYRVWADDNQFTDCCEEHLWTVFNPTIPNSTKTITTKEIWKRIKQGYLTALPHTKFYKNNKTRTITRVQRLHKYTNMQCIMVSGSDNLYLTDNNIVTHNTTMLQQKIIQMYDAFPDCDIGIMTDTKTDQRDKGTFAGFHQFLFKNAPQDLKNWVFTADRIFRKRNDGRIPNEIKMFSIQKVDERDENVSKDKYTNRPMSLLIIDEVQKIHNADILDNALATFTRQMRGEGEQHSMLIMCGNPDEEAIWINDYYEQLTLADDWITLRPTYKDIIKRLPKSTLSIIETTKKHFPERYNRLYLGILNGLSELTAYSTFNEELHFKDRKDTDKSNFQYFFVGIDYASAADALAACPCPLLDSGRVVVLERFRYSPKLTHSIGLAPSQQAELMANYLMWLDRRYGVTYNEVPIILSIDAAADTFAKQMLRLQEIYWCPADLRKQGYDYRAFWDNVSICKFGKLKNKNRGVELVKDAFANNAVEIMKDDTGYQFYNKRDGIPPKRDQLVWELQNIRWTTDLGRKALNKRDENDMVDALEYGLAPIFTDCHNMKYAADGTSLRLFLDNVAFKFDHNEE